MQNFSHFSELDREILNSCRSVANTCTLKKPKGKDVTNLIGIDVRRAYTSEMAKITRVPVFNEFDRFFDYDGHEIEEYTLYIVKSVNFDTFFNKKYNLAYGKFLSEELSYNPSAKIVAFKRPSNIKKVNYKKHIDELYRRR